MRVGERVTAELERVLVGNLGATTAQHELEVPDPDARIKPHAQPVAAAESEGVVGVTVGIAEDEHMLEPLAALVVDQRLGWRERHHDQANPDLADVVKHLDQVLAARQSGQVAQEDDQRLLAGQRRQ